MCRYSFTSYKDNYVCFNCRAGFKRRLLSDVDVTRFVEINDLRDDRKKKMLLLQTAQDFKCPNCAGKMVNLGKDLRLPVKNKVEQWRALDYLYRNGYRFKSCDCNGLGFVPHTVSAAKEYIEANREKSKGEFLLQMLA